MSEQPSGQTLGYIGIVGKPLRYVDAPAGACEQQWVNPESITVNSGNPRIHPPEQTAAVESFILSHGWVAPLVFNLKTWRLVDGHDRLATAIREGWPAVPVWLGKWTEEQEAEIILALAESGRAATWDPARTRAVIDRLSGTSEAVRRLVADLEAREGLGDAIRRAKEQTALRAGTEKSDAVGASSYDEPTQDIRERALAAEPSVLSASKVRLVNLFLDADQRDRFNEHMDVLQEHLGLGSVTEVVLKIAEDAYCAALRGGVGRRRG